MPDFPSVQDFAFYSRLVKCEKSSAGKKLGTSGDKIGNPYLKWAFSEAAVLFVAKCAQGRTMETPKRSRRAQSHSRRLPPPATAPPPDGQRTCPT